MEQATVEDCVTVPARGDGLQRGWLRRDGLSRWAGALVGDGEVASTHAIEEEHAREQWVAQAARCADVLIEMEADGNVGRVGAADPPFGARAGGTGRGHTPERLHGFLDGVRWFFAAGQPESSEVAPRQPSRPQPRDGPACALDEPLIERGLDDPGQRLRARSFGREKSRASIL